MEPEFPIELMPGEQCPCCGLRRPRDSREWKYGDGDRSYVPIDRVRFIFIEISHRIGTAEGARRIGTGRHNLYKIVSNKPEKKFVERHTAMAAVRLLKELRRDNVVFSKQSIRRGAVARGETPRTPTRRKDYYRDPARQADDRIRKAKERQAERENELQQLTGY